MTEDVFRWVIASGVSLAALSMIVQAFVVFRIFRVSETVSGRVTALSDKAEPVIDSAKRLVDENRPKIANMAAQAEEIVSTARTQVARMDELITETTERAKIRIERIDTVLEDTIDRVQETTAAVQTTILKPVREVNGVISGVRAAVSTLGRKSRASVDSATQDEEMFI